MGIGSSAKDDIPLVSAPGDAEACVPPCLLCMLANIVDAAWKQVEPVGQLCGENHNFILIRVLPLNPKPSFHFMFHFLILFRSILHYGG